MVNTHLKGRLERRENGSEVEEGEQASEMGPTGCLISKEFISVYTEGDESERGERKEPHFSPGGTRHHYKAKIPFKT